MRIWITSLLIGTVLVCAGGLAHAGIIGISHVGPGNGQWGSDGIEAPLDPSDTAGVPPWAQQNWNNIAGTSGSATDLTDSDGVATTADVEWTTTLGTWDTANPMSTGDEIMMHGYLDADQNGATVTVSEIPFATYDVYVYHESGGGDGRIATYTIGGQTIWAKDHAGTFTGDPGDYVEDGYATQADAEAGDGGHYIVFSGLSGSSFTLDAVGVTTGTKRAPIQGLQIVPEPATLALLGAGAAVALVRRRRR